MQRGHSFYNQSYSSKNTVTLRDEAKKLRAQLEVKEKEKARIQYALNEKQRQEDELKKLREQERLKQERESKTRRYFDLNNFDHKIPPIGDPYYYGDLESKFAAWRPNGQGQFCLYDNPVVEGTWVKGNFVKGKITFSDGSIWEGGIEREVIHGMGKITNAQGETEEAVAVFGSIMVRKSG